jgi:hypothetical protein
VKRLSAIRLVITILFSGALKVVLAAHPLVTDDTGTQGQGNSQLEVNSDRGRLTGSTAHVAGLTYTNGTKDNLDIFGTLPASVATPAGIGDASLGAKWRFWNGQQTSMALKPELFIPTGDEEAGLGTGRASGAVALLASHNGPAWTFHGNVGVSVNRFKLSSARRESRAVTWRTSVAATYALNPWWTAVADIGIAQNLQKAAGKHPAFMLFGFIYSPTSELDFDVGLKAGLTSAEVHRQFGAGITLRF